MLSQGRALFPWQEVWYIIGGSNDRSRETKAKNPGVWGWPQRRICCTLQKEKQKPHFLHATASQTDHERK